ncbi:MAG: low molecular weight phosphotyrosine protein phosphatase [Clostridiales bacterium]|nr:low molecular weight phosphotyrosine protein phosphatase [Clostridiales bacterium]
MPNYNITGDTPTPQSLIGTATDNRVTKLRRILFVCLGNICRSPAAEELFRQVVKSRGKENEWVIDSAGIGGWHIGQLPDKRMRVHASRRGYQLTHHARQVKPADFDDFDLIIGMDSGNLSDLKEIAPSPEAEKKITPMSQFFTIATRYDHVPDPYYEGAEGFELVLDLLEDACNNLFTQLS